MPSRFLHVAFLRGVGGPKPARGEELRRCFAAAGYDRPTPVIATGNVVFGMGRKRKAPDEAALSDMIGRYFGYPLPAILRTGAEVAGMVKHPPFGDSFDPARHTRFVAMLADDAPPFTAMPRPDWDDGYVLAAGSGRDLFFLIDRTRERTPHLMARLERAFGKAVTTRNWSTMEKVAAVIAAG
jgi:uncharacterized protein (DUF1697 family)